MANGQAARLAEETRATSVITSALIVGAGAVGAAVAGVIAKHDPAAVRILASCGAAGEVSQGRLHPERRAGKFLPGHTAGRRQG